MNPIQYSDPVFGKTNDDKSELLPEYVIDYANTRANPYAARRAEQNGFVRFGDQVLVPLDRDVLMSFHTASEVNTALRLLIKASA
jgi:hypothetical protein